jgi:hypothetical protein
MTKIQLMTIDHRIHLLKKLGQHILSDDPQWLAAREKASYENGWFVPEFINYQLNHIAKEYLDEEKLIKWVSFYNYSGSATHPGHARKMLHFEQHTVQGHPSDGGDWQAHELTNKQDHLADNDNRQSPPSEGWTRQHEVAQNSLYDAAGVGRGETNPKTIGIIMAGNIPLAGMHDFISGFISGHHLIIKPSSKDAVLITAIINKLKEWEPSLSITIAEQLKNCDAYIATGSNNSARYFDYYFSKYPHIIRKNRTSAAILTGNETSEELTRLADDVYLYFGLGCRNVTKIYVPENYDFIPLLEAFKKYDWVFDNHKYKNNYDYQLAIMIINNIYYMTNSSILLKENKALFTAISLLHYEFCTDINEVKSSLENNPDIQCVVGEGFLPFGTAQTPALSDYADKADTLKFLLEL